MRPMTSACMLKCHLIGIDEFTLHDDVRSTLADVQMECTRRRVFCAPNTGVDPNCCSRQDCCMLYGFDVVQWDSRRSNEAALCS